MPAPNCWGGAGDLLEGFGEAAGGGVGESDDGGDEDCEGDPDTLGELLERGVGFLSGDLGDDDPIEIGDAERRNGGEHFAVGNEAGLGDDALALATERDDFRINGELEDGGAE